MQRRWLPLLAPTLLLLTVVGGAAIAAAPMPAALPAAQVDITMPSPHGNTMRVAAGDSLQAALVRAQPGDVIELQAGVQFRGPFTLPNKTGTDWIVIRSDSSERLPPAGTRVSSTDAPAMPVLLASKGSVLATAPGAHHYRFIGIEIRPVTNTFLYNLVSLGSGNETAAQLPHHIVFERCYLHGDASGTRRGIALNGANIAIIDSRLTGFKEYGADTQAIAGWNGPGPFLIANNHLEAAGENVMFGGATPTIRDLVPTDITIRGNQFSKPLEWKQDDTSYAGRPWTVKNLLELKNARRVFIEGNVFENNWAAAQNGYAILFTVRNEDGKVPWATVSDVTFRHNLLRRIGAGINVLARDENPHPSVPASRITIDNNLFTDMSTRWGKGALLQLLDGASDLTITRNTAANEGAIIISDGRPHTRVLFSHNVVMQNEYGVIGSGTLSGLSTMQRYFPDMVFDHNVIIGGQTAHYPTGNAFPASADTAGFVNAESGDFRPRHNSGDGVDFDALCAALSASEQQRFCRFETPAFSHHH